MQPYVVLRDLAETAVIDSTPQDKVEVAAPTGATAESSAQDFLTFVDTLLDKNRRRQGLFAPGLRGDQDSGPQGSHRQRTL